MTRVIVPDGKYIDALHDVVSMLEESRRAASRNINALMTATYWQIGRRIVEFEQGGAERAAYGQALLQRLSADLTARFGRGSGADNLELMRLFYQSYGDRRFPRQRFGNTERRSRCRIPNRRFGISRLSNWHKDSPSRGLTMSG